MLAAYNGNKLKEEFQGYKIALDYGKDNIKDDKFYKIVDYNYYSNTITCKEIKPNGQEYIELLKECPDRTSCNIDNISKDKIYKQKELKLLGRTKEGYTIMKVILEEYKIIA